MFGQIIWIFGLSGSGKTTLGSRLSRDLGFLFLDSDLVRQIIGEPQDFSVAGRIKYQEHLRYHVRDLQYRSNNLIVASITPLQDMRNWNRMTLDNYYEVYLRCNILELFRRDPKGFYAKARNGEIADFTGVTSPFEEPEEDRFGDNSIPDLIIDTDKLTEEESYSMLREGTAKIQWRI